MINVQKIREPEIREAVGVFKNANALYNAVNQLENTVFSREKLSVLGDRADIEKMFGTSEIAPKYVEDNSNAPRQILVRPEEKAIGTGSMIGAGAYLGAVGVLLAGGAAATIPDVITAAVFGGGIGGVLAKILGAYLDRHIEKQIEKGGLVLWVQTERPEYERIACDILKKNGAKHVHIHAF